MSLSNERNVPQREDFESRNLGRYTSLLRDAWISFGQPALRWKDIEASLAFIWFLFLFVLLEMGTNWDGLVKSLESLSSFCFLLERKNYVTMFLLFLVMRDLLDGWSCKWKRQECESLQGEGSSSKGFSLLPSWKVSQVSQLFSWSAFLNRLSIWLSILTPSVSLISGSLYLFDMC